MTFGMECLLISVGSCIPLLLLFVVFIYQLIELYQFRNMPPGPRFTNLPIIGNLMSFDLKAKTFPDAVKRIRLKRKYGGVLSLKLGSRRLVIASSAEAVREVLVTRSADYSGRPHMYSLTALSNGGKAITFADGLSWKHLRRIFASTLRHYMSNIPLLEDRVGEETRNLLHGLEDQEGKSFDPACFLDERIAAILCGVIFGKGCDVSDPEIKHVIHLNEIGLRSPDEMQAMLFLDFFPGTRYFPFKSRKKIVDVFLEIQEIIRPKLRQRENNLNPEKSPTSFMEALLYARRDAALEDCEEKLPILSEDHLVSTLQDVFAAGYETTAVACTWALGYLAQNPMYQRDIQKQLQDVVGSDRMPRLADRFKLPLLNAAVMEVLRLGNVVPQAVPHRALRDSFLCGYRVPMDTIVVADVEAVHHDPLCWENPTKFDPSRHIDEEGNLITNQGNFYPFGAGRRVCPGEPFAKVEIFLFLSWMLHKFTFLPAEEGQDHPDLKPLRGISQFPAPFKIRAVKRN